MCATHDEHGLGSIVAVLKGNLVGDTPERALREESLLCLRIGPIVICLLMLPVEDNLQWIDSCSRGSHGTGLCSAAQVASID